MTTEMTGAEIVCRVLREEGVEYVFGVPGSTEAPLITALAQTPEIKYILAAHESVSVGMADGYARTSGKIGVVMAHTTPGCANTIGCLFNAYKANTPILVIIGQQDSRLEYRDPILDVNLQPLVSEVTKAYWKVDRIQDLPIILNRAIKEALTLPKAPVVVVIPQNIQAESTPADILPAQGRQLAMDVRTDSQALKRAARLLHEAKNPVILAGHEVPDAGAIPELIKLAETIGASVFAYSEPRLIFPTNHPQYFGYVRSQSDVLRRICGNADVLLALGKTVFGLFDYPTTPILTPATKVIHVDIDAQGLAKTYCAEIALVAHQKIALAELASEIENQVSSKQKEALAQKAERIAGIRSQMRAAVEAANSQDLNAIPIKPWRAFKDIASLLAPDAVVVNESITLTSYATQTIQLSQQAIYYNCAAYLGWGIPVALGTCLATPRRPVVAIVGDGSALFGIQALWTAARYNLPVVVVVLNNQGYGAIRGFVTRYASLKQQSVDTSMTDIGDPYIYKLAEAFGIQARRIENPAEIKDAMKWAIALGKPAVVEIMVDPADSGPRQPEPK